MGLNCFLEFTKKSNELFNFFGMFAANAPAVFLQHACSVHRVLKDFSHKPLCF